MMDRKKIAFFSAAALLFLTPPFVAAQGSPEVSALSHSPQNRVVLPTGWKVFRGTSGLVVLHPHDWNIRVRGGGAFLAYRAGPGGAASALVMVQPIESIDGRATGVVGGLGRIFPDLFPGVNIFKTRVVSRTPEVAVAQMEYAPKGIRFRGLVMCFKHDTRGVVYAIAANVGTWQRDEPLMKRILRSFFYSGGGASGQGGQTAGASLPEMVPWNDPLEGAFACPVPRGWNVDGGLKRYSALDVRSEILVTSADNRMLARIGDSFIPPMELPAPILQQYGVVEGGWFSRDGQSKLLVMRYLPSTLFLKTIYLPQRVGPVGNVRERNFQQLSQQAQSLWARAGMPVRVDTAEMTFDAQTEMGHRKGYAFVQTVLVPTQGVPDRGNWYVTHLFGYLAAPGAESVAEGVLNRMVLGYRENPNWRARQSRLTGEVSRIRSETNRQVDDMINQTYMNRSRAQERTHERWSRAFRNEVLIEDPNTGQRYEVPSGGNYYWRIGPGNNFIPTEGPDRVFLPNHWVEEMKIVD
ncbi:MAG: hypothetical protein WAL98_12380 [Desulfatiglandaceae bacterium]